MLKQTNIKRDLLQTTLEANLKDHIEMYELASKAFETEYQNYVASFAKKVKSGDFTQYFDPPEKPRSYEKEYNNVIEQLKYSADEIITLNSTEFANYILDEWSFSHSFYSNVSTYVTTQTLSASNSLKMSKYVS